MIGLPAQGRAWGGSAVLSVALHGAVAALLLFDLPLPAAPPGPAPEPRIEVIATVTAAGEDGPDAPLLTSTVAVDTDAAPLTTASAASEVIRRDSDPLLLAAGDDDAAAPAPELQPAAGPAQDQPPDPRIAELIARIRDNMTDPCMLALPLLRGEDEVLLSVVATSDRQIAGLTERLTQGLDIGLSTEAVLIDSRQCPGATFARNDRMYPAHGLGLEFEARSLDSGGSMRGRITNGAGYYNTLLMVDDNGTVHDLRRFLTVAAGEVSFDVPMARTGASRDTHQLIIAIATSDRPRSVATHAGEMADRFFAALTAETGASPALIGVGSLYVR